MSGVGRWRVGTRWRGGRRLGFGVSAAALALLLGGCALIAGPGAEGSVPPVSERPATEPPDELPTTLEGYAAQRPGWVPCVGGKLCAEVLAPLDWADPAGERVTLHLVKQRATGKARLGTLFVNPGGPGASGADFVADSIDFAVGSPLQERFDVIGWDPRGVGKSSAVACLDAADMDDFLFGQGPADSLETGSDEWIAAASAETAAFGAACAARTGALLGHVDTVSTVQDLDMLRAVAGDERLNYLGYSYGTAIGARYAQRYPERVGRLVFDGVLDPAASQAEVVREQTLGFETALRSYLADCLTRKECPFSGSVDAAMLRISGLLDRVDAHPIRGTDGRLLTVSTLVTAIITPLYSTDSWRYLDELFATIPEGDADTGLWLADYYYSRTDGVYQDNSTEAFIAINCLDYPRELDPQAMRAEAAELARIAPTIGRFQGYGELGCAGWPAESTPERGPVQAPGAAPILVVGTTGDPATPFRWAESLASQLESGVLLTHDGEGHTAYGKNECVNTAVEAYLLRGTLPAEGTRCR